MAVNSRGGFDRQASGAGRFAPRLQLQLRALRKLCARGQRHQHRLVQLSEDGRALERNDLIFHRPYILAPVE
jgi:hypothetical protein